MWNDRHSSMTGMMLYGTGKWHGTTACSDPLPCVLADLPPGKVTYPVALCPSPQAKAPTPLHAVPLPPGKGAYGTVYKAVDAVSGEVVAIKVISLADQPAEDFKQIEKEIEFLAACDHPNVVRYLVSGGEEGVNPLD